MTSSLVGRDIDVEKVETALQSHQLVTLTGVGGVGKTRLALAVATKMAEEVSRRGVGFRAGCCRRSCRGAPMRSRP